MREIGFMRQGTGFYEPPAYRREAIYSASRKKEMLSGGKNYVNSAPAFSNDGKRVLVCSGNTVTIFSTSTGLQVSELEGHRELVTSVFVVPASTPASRILCYCWTASLDGTIRYWDFSIPELTKTIDIRLPIHSMVIPGLLGNPAESNKGPPRLFAYVFIEDANSRKNNPNTFYAIRKCNLIKSRLVDKLTLAETEKPRFLTISPSGKYMGVEDKRKLRLWELPARDSDHVLCKKMRLHHTKNFTTLAFHPTERIVAAGDVTGRILIWRNFGDRTFSSGDKLVKNLMTDEDDRPGVRENDDADACTTWHWHSAEVKLLFFSSDGAYLYSGGKEGVLVVWQLDTGKKKFLPRIGSPLLYFVVSPDPSLSCLSCADNRIHLLKMPSMEILKSISGIKLPCSVPELKGSFSGFVVDQTAGVIAVCTEKYCIQFYSLFDDRELSEVQVCEINHQPGDEVMVIVTSVALSYDGSVMSTVETRLPEEEMGGLISLKFWARGSQSNDFSLSTIIYEPHRDAGISGVAFHPTRHMAVSASYGGDFKIWVQNHGFRQKDQRPHHTGWTCHAVGSYKKKPMTAVAFSPDGSVLAVAAEGLVTLWDPEKNILVAVIGESFEPIVSLSFTGKSEYLVSASQGSNPQLSIWSMSKLALFWSYKLHAEAIACTADESLFAVLTLLPKSSTPCVTNRLQDTDGVILLFNAGDPIPIATWFARKGKGGGLAFIHAIHGHHEGKISDGQPEPALLAYINGDHEYAVFDPNGDEARNCSIARNKPLGSIEETGQLGYASIYGELPEFNLKSNQNPPVSLVPSERPWETIFSGPSHNLPPLTKLCSVFLASLLEKRSATVE